MDERWSSPERPLNKGGVKTKLSVSILPDPQFGREDVRKRKHQPERKGPQKLLKGKAGKPHSQEQLKRSRETFTADLGEVVVVHRTCRN